MLSITISTNRVKRARERIKTTQNHAHLPLPHLIFKEPSQCQPHVLLTS